MHEIGAEHPDAVLGAATEQARARGTQVVHSTRLVEDNDEVGRVLDHHGDTIVRARYDGTYDKTTLPEELVMSNYFSVRDGKIVSLSIIFNQPSPY